MQTFIFEGTFAEVQKRFNALHLTPEAPLRLIVTESTPIGDISVAHLANAQRRNGLILAPTKDEDTVVTVELVKRLSED